MTVIGTIATLIRVYLYFFSGFGTNRRKTPTNGQKNFLEKGAANHGRPTQTGGKLPPIVLGSCSPRGRFNGHPAALVQPINVAEVNVNPSLTKRPGVQPARVGLF